MLAYGVLSHLGMGFCNGPFGPQAACVIARVNVSQTLTLESLPN